MPTENEIFRKRNLISKTSDVSDMTSSEILTIKKVLWEFDSVGIDHNTDG